MVQALSFKPVSTRLCLPSSIYQNLIFQRRAMTQWMHSLIAGVLMQLTWSFYLKDIPGMRAEVRKQKN